MRAPASGPMHLPHPTPAEVLDDAVMPEGGADHFLPLRRDQLLERRVVPEGFKADIDVAYPIV